MRNATSKLLTVCVLTVLLVLSACGGAPLEVGSIAATPASSIAPTIIPQVDAAEPAIQISPIATSTVQTVATSTVVPTVTLVQSDGPTAYLRNAATDTYLAEQEGVAVLTG